MTVDVTGRLQTLGAALLFSTGGAAIKATTLSAFQVASFRAGIAVVALVTLLPSARQRWTARAMLVGVAYASTTTLFVIANKLTTAANSIFLQSSAPLYVLMLSPWLLGERIRRSDLLYMLTIIVGLGAFFVGVRPPDELAQNPMLGNLLAICAGVFWALTLIGLRWLGRGEAGSGQGMTAVVMGNVMAFCFVLPLALPVGAASAEDIVAITFLGVVQIGFAYALLTAALKRVAALEASLLLLIEPVLSPVWAWLVHGEAPGGWAIAGGAVILGATLVKTATGLRRAEAR